MEWDYFLLAIDQLVRKKTQNPRMYQHFPNQSGNVGYTSLKKARSTRHVTIHSLYKSPIVSRLKPILEAQIKLPCFGRWHTHLNQWPFQEPKLEVPTIYKAYFSGLNFREYPHNIWPYLVQYLHFRILEFPLIKSYLFF